MSGRKYLLTPQALPVINVPEASQHLRREFRLPDGVTTPVGTSPSVQALADDGSLADDEPHDVMDMEDAFDEIEEELDECDLEQAAPEEKPPTRPDPTDPRFRDRTLKWFEAGDELDGEVNMNDSFSDLKPVNVATAARGRMYAAVGVGMLGVAGALVWWLSS